MIGHAGRQAGPGVVGPAVDRVLRASGPSRRRRRSWLRRGACSTPPRRRARVSSGITSAIFVERVDRIQLGEDRVADVARRPPVPRRTARRRQLRLGVLAGQERVARPIGDLGEGDGSSGARSGRLLRDARGAANTGRRARVTPVAGEPHRDRERAELEGIRPVDRDRLRVPVARADQRRETGRCGSSRSGRRRS